MIRIKSIQADHFKQLRALDLQLPKRGRFLVQGLNEAGKSTVFEAVYFAMFGRPLVTETGAVRMDDLIRYGAEEAFVRLELLLGDSRKLDIQRRVRLGKPNVWSLDVHGADGLEEVRGNRSVNERIEAELGFDGEALLNTCFVEQKKLEKLEGLGKAQREQSLMKLLNLDQMIALADGLRVRPADREDLKRIEARMKLAEQRELRPALDEKVSALSKELKAWDVHSALEAFQQSFKVLEAQDAAWRESARKASLLSERAALAEQLGEGLQALGLGQAARKRALDAQQRLKRAQGELALSQNADQEMSKTTAAGKALARIRRRFDYLDELRREREELEARVEARDSELETLAEDLKRLNDLRRALVESRASSREAHDELGMAQHDLRAFDVRDALKDWLDASAGRAALDSNTGSEQVLLSRQKRMRGRLYASAGIGISAGLGAAFFWRAGPDLAFWLSGIITLAALLATVLALRMLQALSVAIAREEGRMSTKAASIDALEQRIDGAKRRLRALNAVAPADESRALEALHELDERLERKNKESAEAEIQRLQSLEAKSKAEVELASRQEEELRRRLSARDGKALGAERDAWALRAGKIRGILDKRDPMLRAQLSAAGLDSRESIEPRLGDLRDNLAELRALSKRRAALEAALKETQSLEAAEWASAKQVWEDLPQSVEREAFDVHASDEDWAELAAKLNAAYEKAGGDAVRTEAAEAGRESAAAEAKMQSRERTFHERSEDLFARLSSYDAGDAELLERWRGGVLELRSGPASDSPVRESTDSIDALLEETRTKIERPGSGSREKTLSALDDARRDLDIVNHELGRLEGLLGLEAKVLDAEAERSAFEEMERVLRVRGRGHAIVDQASRNVVQRILPSTLAHMRQLLPVLTQGRYHDAQLSEDYRIQVWDDRASTWKLKNIFSGGTRDQLSLALRLAFALATLPEERGAAPSFLFLDEPLGAFDAERAKALIGLLTEGALAESFDQIFLISHVPVDAGLFDHRILMADGQVSAPTLGTDEQDAPDSSIA